MCLAEIWCFLRHSTKHVSFFFFTDLHIWLFFLLFYSPPLLSPPPSSSSSSYTFFHTSHPLDLQFHITCHGVLKSPTNHYWEFELKIWIRSQPGAIWADCLERLSLPSGWGYQLFHHPIGRTVYNVLYDTVFCYLFLSPFWIFAFVCVSRLVVYTVYTWLVSPSQLKHWLPPQIYNY